MSEAKINISGNFIDSFIYSGVLFTVNVDGVLCTYSWNYLLENYLEKYNEFNRLYNKFIDCRKDKDVKFGDDILIEIDEKFLSKYQKGICYELDVWTTDLDIKDNILYISSERGLEALPFLENWNNGKIMKFKDLYSVWKEDKVFGLSTGTWGRTILAAGVNGALEVVNNDIDQIKNIGIKQQEGKVINNQICLDCEWDTTSTIAILDNLDNQKILKYKQLISERSFKSDFIEKDSDKKISQEDVESTKEYISHGKPENFTDENLFYSWFEGERIFSLNNSNELLNYDFSDESWVISGQKNNFSDISLKKIRETNVGKILETENDELYRIKGSHRKLLCNELTSWRVFPRSKNYQDRIHIVNEEYLQISIFD